MKVWIGITALFVMFLAIGAGSGCGGGSGGSGGTNGGPNIARYAVEATKSGVLIDPTNIVQGETVQFVVAGYTTTNQRIVQSSSGWTTDPTGQSEGTLSAGGSFTATASGPIFTVSATAGGQTRTGTARVRPPGQALVTGRVMNGYNEAVLGAEVDFYDAGNTLVGTSLVQSNGTFRASVPATAVTFEINKNTIPGYYKEYKYNNKWYLPQGICRAPLPALTNGTTTSLLGDIIVPPTQHGGSSLPPPPPPSPCT